MIIGIDLGTTNSAAAYFNEDGPQLIPNSIGEFLTKSVVAVEHSGELLIGATAKEFQVLHPERCASCFKRQMGTNWSTTLGDHKFSAVELSSLILRSIKRDAEAFLDRDVERCVITVPAYFRDDQRKATIEAGKLAGLIVERIINEPTAAAMAYGIHEKDTEKTVVVFDLGGGTFDISVVDFFEGAIEVRASAGEAILGGEDFTRSLARYVLEQQSLNFETAELRHPLMVSRLIQQCEQAKIALSKNATAAIRVPSEAGELDVEGVPFELSRTAFDESAKHLLARIETPVRRAMNDAKLKWTDVDELILVGGATRMGVIHELTAKRISREPLCERDPDHVVALGAAVQAALIGQNAAVDDVVVVDVAPFTLGVEIAKEIGDEYRKGYSSPIINRNDVIPTSRSHTFGTTSNNQTEVSVRVYQGESRRVSGNHFLGELTVRDIPLGPAGQGLEIRFTYDANGVLEVETTIQKTGKRSSLIISKHAEHLSPEQIAATVATFEKLKIHPREKDINRYLLLRAERIFEELPTVLRSQLTRLIDSFESAMDRQDTSAVEATAGELNLFLSNFTPYEETDE